ncbi:hypothetical protein BDD12DRAFT_194725 [Trichophaea hybrida]|nr:hypothetical protein BDD12DRAFT_194725 [Trichophaea hybrida]
MKIRSVEQPQPQPSLYPTPFRRRSMRSVSLLALHVWALLWKALGCCCCRPRNENHTPNKQMQPMPQEGIQPLTIQPRAYCSVGLSFFHRFLYCTLEYAASESVCTLLYLSTMACESGRLRHQTRVLARFWHQAQACRRAKLLYSASF